MHSFGVGLLASLLASTAGAQGVEPKGRVNPAANVAEPDDIVVEGYRLGKSRDTRVQVPADTATVLYRQIFEYSERLAKCAARSKLSDTSRLRAVVDGEFNSPRQATAQDRLARIYVTCGESPTLLSFTGVPQTAHLSRRALAGDFKGLERGPDFAPLGHSIYDRGAFTIQAMKLYAPDLTLTRTQTQDPDVKRRFVLRESARNRFRLPSDQRYFGVATCMVQKEPALSVRLALSEGSAKLGDVQEALIDRTRACVGGAKRVQVDPTQFRLYIADAVYRWAVAARNVGSLIPRTEMAAVDR